MSDDDEQSRADKKDEIISGMLPSVLLFFWHVIDLLSSNADRILHWT